MAYNRITVRVPESTEEQVEQVVEDEDYMHKSELIREAIRQRVGEDGD